MRLTFVKIIRIGLYLTLFTPLFFTPFTYFPWHFGKTVIFQMMVEVLVWLGVVYSLTHPLFPSLEKRGRTFLKSLNRLDWSVIVFLAVLVITALTGVDFTNSFWSNQSRADGVFMWLHFGAYYFLLRFNLREKDEWLKFFKISVIVALAVAVTIFFEKQLPLSWQSGAGGGILGNRAFTSAYLLLAIALSVFISLAVKQWQRVLFGASAVLLGAALFVSGTRGAELGFLAGLMAAVFGLSFWGETERQRWIGRGILVVLIFLSAVFAIGNTQRLVDLATSGTGETRLLAWQIAGKGFKERPLFGWGMGNFDIVFNKYYNPQFLKHSFSETVWDKPHNWLLEIGGSAGIVGVLSYLLMIGLALFYLWRRKSWVLAGGLAAYFVQDLFFFETINALLLFITILAFVSFVQVIRAPQTEAQKSLSTAARFRFPVFAAGCLLALFFSFSFYRYHWLPLKASYYLKQADQGVSLAEWSRAASLAIAVPVSFRGEVGVFLAEQLTIRTRAGLTMVGDETINAVRQLGSLLKDEAKRRSLSVAYRVWAGQVYMVLGEQVDPAYYHEAEQSLLEAQMLSSEKQDVLFVLERLYLLEKNFDKAIAIGQKAVEVAPNIHTSHWFLGLSYVASGEVKTGLKHLEESIDKGHQLSRSDQLYVLDLYAQEQNYAKLIEGYQALVQAEPTQVNWYIKLATAYALAGNKQKALELAEQAVKLDPRVKPSADEFIEQYKLK